jgi:hypothetical protein
MYTFAEVKLDSEHIMIKYDHTGQNQPHCNESKESRFVRQACQNASHAFPIKFLARESAIIQAAHNA